MEKAVYTVADLAQRWQCSHDIIYDLLRQGKLKAFKLGSAYRISAEAVSDFESGK